VHLAEQQQQKKAVRLAVEGTARELISEASKKLTDALQGSGNNLQGANCEGCTGHVKCWE